MMIHLNYSHKTVTTAFLRVMGLEKVTKEQAVRGTV